MTTMFWTTTYDVGADATTAIALVRLPDGELKEIRGKETTAPLAPLALCMALYEADLTHLAYSLMDSEGCRSFIDSELTDEEWQPTKVVSLNEIEFFSRCPNPCARGGRLLKAQPIRTRAAKTLRTLKPRTPEE